MIAIMFVKMPKIVNVYELLTPESRDPFNLPRKMRKGIFLERSEESLLAGTQIIVITNSLLDNLQHSCYCFLVLSSSLSYHFIVTVS